MRARKSKSLYAVIFTSMRTSYDREGYEMAAKRMMELAKVQDGFVAIESTRDSDGFGITVSYWTSKMAIKKWKSHAEHFLVQERGRAVWYKSFATRICKVESEQIFLR